MLGGCCPVIATWPMGRLGGLRLGALGLGVVVITLSASSGCAGCSEEVQTPPEPDCSSCHGSVDNPGPPASTEGIVETSHIGVGAHQTHLNDSDVRQAMWCQECHVVPTTIDEPAHRDGLPAEVIFGLLAVNGGAEAQWDRPNATCKQVYCHGATLAGGANTEPRWTQVDGSQAFCGSCHGIPPLSPHPASYDCFTCHPDTVEDDGSVDVEGGYHINGAIDVVAGSCLLCHSAPIGSRRQIVGPEGDFQRTSHHVATDLTDAHCQVCHYQADHQSGTVKLKDPDQGEALVHSYDPADPTSVEAFCLACHDADGAKALDTPTQPFGDGKTPPDIDASGAWAGSAHKQLGYTGNAGKPISCMGDGLSSGCHGNGHGSDSVKLLSANSSTTIDTFCFSCHSDGKVTNVALSGASLADDIEQAFGMKYTHGLGTEFSVDERSYTLGCTSCHNPHVVTGKHWDADQEYSSVTRPDLSADPEANPRAMGTQLWGTIDAEKMAAYATAFSGVYLPPSADPLSATQLPDYDTFCSDCHNSLITIYSSQLGRELSQMSWSGFDMHGGGLGRDANMNKGAVTAPYDDVSADNYIMACVDCHELHGSPNAFMLRTTINGVTSTSTLAADSNSNSAWTAACAACHLVTATSPGPPCANNVSHGPPPWATAGCQTCHGHNRMICGPGNASFGTDMTSQPQPEDAD